MFRKKTTLFQKVFWQKKSYCRIILPEANPGTLQNIYKMEHFPTKLNSLQETAAVTKSSMLDMARVLKPRLVTKGNGNKDH